METKQARHIHPVRILAWLATLLVMAALVGSSSNVQAQPSTPAGQGRIAFTITSGNPPHDIFSMDADGSNITQLTNHPSIDAAPSWSPDGSRIAFTSERGVGGVDDIFVMNADGSNQHSITAQASADLDPAWSPDGTRIAFSSNRDGTQSEIYVMNTDGTNVTRLTTDQTGSAYPVWSPDGSRIAFVNINRDGDPDNEIYVMNSDGSNQQRITDPSVYTVDSNLSWSPAGDKITFARMAGGASQIYSINVDGSGLLQLTTGDASYYPTWSSDSQRIAFARMVGANGQIFVMNANGSNVQQLTNVPQSPGAFSPNWQRQGAVAPVVLVQNEDGLPVQGAEVYHECSLVGTTNISGTISLARVPALDDKLLTRTLVYTGTTTKGSHDGWAYHVWLTNITQESSGFESAYVVTDTTALTHTLVVKKTQAQIGFNIVASVEYNATDNELAIISAGLGGGRTSGGGYNLGATDYLMDVTDGQMFFEKVNIHENMQNWNDADFQFFASYLRADANARTDGRSAITGTCCHIHVQSSGDFGTPWNQFSAFSTLIHEFAHYAIGAYDEYFYQADGDGATCNLTPDPSLNRRASTMATRNSTEFCTISNHNILTHHNNIHGESVWDTVKDNWGDTGNQWSIQIPSDRGVTVVPGPSMPLCTDVEGTVPVIHSVGPASCSPIPVTVTLDGSPVMSASVSLATGIRTIDQGITDAQGKITVYGGVSNQHRIMVRGDGFPGILYTGSEFITSCNAVTIELSIIRASSNADVPNGQWPQYTLTSTPDFEQSQVHTVLDFVGQTPDEPALYGSQGGEDRQAIALTYDPVEQRYTGDYAFDPNGALDFQLEVGLNGDDGELLFPYRFNATRFYTSGPEGSQGAPSSWDLFPPETSTNLSVNSNSMPDSTGVMGGKVDMPAAPPDGLLAVGGPFTVEGQNPISGSVTLSLEYQSEYFCGLVPGTTSMYRYNGQGWDALTTQLTEEWHLAAADITQWGIYAVFAENNPQTVFSDVPAGSTFFDYINWITCHGIAGGYSDGTFRPSNNATRGQISKMMALTYQWYLEAPENGYTFADVPQGSTFHLYVEAAYREGVVSGYPCGGAGEPCDAQNRPYFRPSNNVTRGQIAKIISNGSRFGEVVSGQSFEDVAPGSTFYEYVGRMAVRSIINGYPCGGPGEPCGTGNMPYFRPGTNATRGQLSKMVYLAAQPR